MCFLATRLGFTLDAGLGAAGSAGADVAGSAGADGGAFSSRTTESIERLGAIRLPPPVSELRLAAEFFPAAERLQVCTPEAVQEPNPSVR